MKPSLSILVASAAFLLQSHAAPRPNVIVIMGDDMGISDLGCYGSEIDTPVLDKLAAGGLRFTQFYNTARCCPTRASLLSGLYPHQAGIGHMMNDRGHDGYRGELNRECLTIPEALKTSGYGTYMAGKWHVTSKTAADGPKDNWPRQRGFDRFYGTIHGAGSLWDPNSLTRGNTQLAPDNDPEYTPEKAWFYTDAISDQAARYIEEHMKAKPDAPFFCYVSYTAAHWPMHAREETIAKYKGKYDKGYEPFRESRLRKMKELGIVAKDTALSPQAGNWEKMTEKAWDARNMEVYAAMVDEMDQGIGKIVDTVEKAGQLDNTLIFFLQDNGGCAENFGRGKNATTGPRADKPTLPPMAKGELQMHMQPKQTRDGYVVRTGPGVMAGPADTYIGYGQGWANVSNTPFREYKHWVHEGGISTPLIAHWPAGIKRAGELDHNPGHLIDIMATCVELAAVDYPKDKTPLEGRSLDVAFKGKAIEREALFWEHEGNCAIRKGDWKLVRKENKPWELYNVAKDRIESMNLAADKPELVKSLASEFDTYADRAMVSPVGTWRGNRKPKKQAFSTKERFKLKSGDNLDQNSAPHITDRGVRIEGTVKSDDTDGVIVAQGGDSLGYAVILKARTLKFLTCVGGNISTVSSTAPLPSSTFKFVAEMSPAGAVKLSANGKEVGNGMVKPVTGMPLDGLHVGDDPGGTVGEYEAGYALDGEIKLTLTLLPEKRPKKAAAAPAKPKRPNPFTPIEDDPKLPRVLLIGDSISIGYTLGVRESLKGKANVHRPPSNCGPTTRGLASIEKWLGDGKWDVIHFNWGLHDLKYMGHKGENLADPNDPKSAPQVPPADYEKNLTTLVERLKKTGAKLIWRNTTPVPEGAKGRVVGDSVKYNAIAEKIMHANGIPTDDLFSLSKQNPEMQRKADVHYTTKGSRKLAEQVAKVIESALAK